MMSFLHISFVGLHILLSSNCYGSFSACDRSLRRGTSGFQMAWLFSVMHPLLPFWGCGSCGSFLRLCAAVTATTHRPKRQHQWSSNIHISTLPTGIRCGLRVVRSGLIRGGAHLVCNQLSPWKTMRVRQKTSCSSERAKQMLRKRTPHCSVYYYCKVQSRNCSIL